jgi:ATP-dependent DNA helicase PIF1
VFRHALKNPDQFFGGMQVIVVGDFFQLPPVADRTFDRPFCFDSQSWKDADFFHVHLTKVMRQTDEEFITHLNRIRLGTCPDDTDRFFKGRTNLQIPQEKLMPVRIMGTNAEVDDHNGGELERLETPVFMNRAKKHWRDKSDYNDLMGSINAVDDLELKVGCQTMILTNDSEGEYANGTMGVFSGVSYGERSGRPQLDIMLGDMSMVKVPMKRWKLYDEHFDPEYMCEIKDKEERDDYEEIHTRAYYNQYPVRCAYGITVHKSQGMSMDRIDFDSRKVFSPGQVYVGLSRARTLQGLRLFNWDRCKVWANKDALRFYNQFQ